MPASEHEAQPPRAVSMSALLAAGAAANAVSTPPKTPAGDEAPDRPGNGGKRKPGPAKSGRPANPGPSGG
ncbi:MULTISPECIES: hypothetical protein [unclassified Streptomyces]|uniref:hypothetical protein n=1 Tax=unclassified Streptomyces TaxID=2593676 RepID=UPI000D0AAB25|nr:MULTISPECIES: hypothetical protein [unclassified Streptomyces]MYY04209.1 hypothetical protein [Streptomyces sp. SID4913]